MQLYSGHAVQESASFIGYLQQQPISAAIAELPALTGGQSPMASAGAQEGSKQPVLPGHSSTGGQHPMQSEGTLQRGTEKESDSPCLTNRIKNVLPDSDTLTGEGHAPLPRPTPIRPAAGAASLRLNKAVLAELGRPTAFSARPPVPAPNISTFGEIMLPGEATAGGATAPDALEGPGFAAIGAAEDARMGRRAEDDGAATVVGWLTGMGLGRYAEALLGAGWDCAEVGTARMPPPRSAARRSVF